MAAVVEASAFLLGLFLCYNIPISMASHAYAQIRSEGGFLFALF
ncbi:hypothetical protein P0095_25 [Streptococcus phage P0095]|uniref:Uncharacterized protein n=1 Tax=Streptococcus phage P0095 TaxID=1971414 RepID=A0A286QP44_9CAUD|nr:hypothetical protein PQE85_gp25 [Streptococcus phage P0095]ARU13175.1 hypothetical protein P0095_25 [Streptococcus phage P0095]